jgi:hypothetical protein
MRLPAALNVRTRCVARPLVDRLTDGPERPLSASGSDAAASQCGNVQRTHSRVRVGVVSLPPLAPDGSASSIASA